MDNENYINTYADNTYENTYADNQLYPLEGTECNCEYCNGEYLNDLMVEAIEGDLRSDNQYMEL